MSSSFKTWTLARPVRRMSAGLVVFVLVGITISLSLGHGIPWFGIAVGTCGWALMAVLAWRRQR